MKRLSLYALTALTRIVADLPLLWMFYFLYFEREGAGGVFDILSNAVVFVAFGTLHSLLARDFAKRYIAQIVGEHYVRAVYVWISAITLSAVLYLWRPISGTLWQTQGILAWVLSLLYLGCIAGMVWTTFYIDYPEFLGVRTLLHVIRNQPAQPPVFSVKGPYAYCRHPMYLLLLIALWVGPVMSHTRLEFALLASPYLLIGTFLEERNLREELGEVYELYRANVPMWLPRLTPWKYERPLE